ncbi:MAG: hypothetical protein L6Q69_01525 [Zoogloea sp.]|nr:hypothetical protein [Zoogloea sp.]
MNPTPGPDQAIQRPKRRSCGRHEPTPLSIEGAKAGDGIQVPAAALGDLNAGP